MHVLIFANGDLSPPGWVFPYLDQAAAVIAADGGAQHVLALSRRPDVLVGDLDSLESGVKETLHGSSTLFLEATPDKDETDLELALLYAVAKYDLPVLVLAGLGGRIDQMFANILLLMHPQLRGHDISFKTQFQRIWLVERKATIEGQPGDTVSLIPIGGDVHIESTNGLRWPLQEEKLVFGPARGVSNVMLDEVATVTIGEGHLLCVHTQREWQR